MKKTPLVFIAILAIAAIVGGYLLISARTASPSSQAPAEQPAGKGHVGNAASDADPYDIAITLTDSGLSDRDITIAAGTRVRFLNASSGEFWPASGVHPTHTLYPEKESTDCLGSWFDACIGLKPGQFFDYTFYYEGSWPYHDHLHAYYSGTITVVAASSSPKAQQ